MKLREVIPETIRRSVAWFLFSRYETLLKLLPKKARVDANWFLFKQRLGIQEEANRLFDEAYGTDTSPDSLSQGAAGNIEPTAQKIILSTVLGIRVRQHNEDAPKHVSTSFVERQNLNIRMGNRRMTRLTNAFSKKAENHAYMMAIHFMHYNFVRIHQTLKVTPAMAAGVTDKLWEMYDMVKVLEDWEVA